MKIYVLGKFLPSFFDVNLDSEKFHYIILNVLK